MYPATVAEVLVDGMKFKPDALRAIKRFRRSKAWRGTIEERLEKFRTLNRELAAAYGIREPVFRFSAAPWSNGYYDPAEHAIGLIGSLSVVTFLHEFGHARGFGERGACRFSINLFRRLFPRSYARCQHSGHTLRRPDRPVGMKGKRRKRT
jgi:hypothetical protein